MLLVAAKLRPFQRDDTPPRLRTLCFLPYFTDAILAAVGGLVNPLGLPGMMRGWKHREEEPGPITRSVAWISTAAVASLLFILVRGRGITWSR